MMRLAWGARSAVEGKVEATDASGGSEGVKSDGKRGGEHCAVEHNW